MSAGDPQVRRNRRRVPRVLPDVAQSRPGAGFEYFYSAMYRPLLRALMLNTWLSRGRAPLAPLLAEAEEVLSRG